jgi:hypothetical protein
MNFAKIMILSADSDSEVEEDREDEWSSSSDEDESKVMLSQKKIYHYYQFTHWKDIESILTKEGSEPRKIGLPSLDELLNILKTPDKRQKIKQLIHLGVKLSDLKYYLVDAVKPQEIKDQVQEELEKKEEIEKELKIVNHLTEFQECSLTPTISYENVICTKSVDCGKQSYTLTVVKCCMKRIHWIVTENCGTNWIFCMILKHNPEVHF